MRMRALLGNIRKAGLRKKLFGLSVLMCLLIACGDKPGDGAPTAPPAPAKMLTDVATILEKPENFFGSEVRLEGQITRQVTHAPEYEFADDTGAIKVDFGLWPIPEMKKEIHLRGRVQRHYEGLKIAVSFWEYMSGEPV